MDYKDSSWPRNQEFHAKDGKQNARVYPSCRGHRVEVGDGDHVLEVAAFLGSSSSEGAEAGIPSAMLQPGLEGTFPAKSQ